jgi:hypothetical protein
MNTDEKNDANARKVLDCGSPLPLFLRRAAMPKRLGTGAVQDADAVLFGQQKPFIRGLN